MSNSYEFENFFKKYRRLISRLVTCSIQFHRSLDLRHKIDYVTKQISIRVASIPE